MKTFCNSNLASYDEETSLVNLYFNVEEALERQVSMYEETGEDFPEEFHIIINGISHAFILGGPQAQGLHLFIRNICEENLYAYPNESPETAHDRIKPFADKAQHLIDRLEDPESGKIVMLKGGKDNE